MKQDSAFKPTFQLLLLLRTINYSLKNLKIRYLMKDKNASQIPIKYEDSKILNTQSFEMFPYHTERFKNIFFFV